MKKSIIALSMLFTCSAHAQLIQHTDQIAEVQFSGSSYELGKHVGVVAKKQILDGIERFNETLGVMLPGLNVIALSKGFDGQDVYGKLQKSSPDAAAYITGLAESLNRDPNLLLAVGMSDEAILESQRSGGMGFLATEKTHQAAAPAKCTSIAIAADGDKAWAASNFDYMGINYEGLIMLKHTDVDGKTRLIQTWAGLIPFGGVTKGAQVMTMNTMADEGTARQHANGEIITDTATPSYHLSWDVYNAQSYADVVDTFKKFDEYTAFFTYTIASANKPAMNIENTYSGKVHVSEGPWIAHANHSLYEAKDFVDNKFAAFSLARQEAANQFMKTANAHTSEAAIRNLLEAKPIWKGRGELMGTVTSTYYEINGNKVDVYFKTDFDHGVVHMTNY
ncbi:C45 family autoproteolytic acyltransferase/hydrolase [Shewanella sp. 10N.261.52.F9]|uniref:C45 family autoproteolytic acyltransferase/hydolase n=1 Tax=Shewanella TaxID=22 RepID=UPI00200CD43F|nr:C45 family autoproteolytic acyltransferase/hydolase [Shewanella marinintestina]MCL1146803.1 C45 family autoproteolytic acyltransferase/hydrolase [Shewanella marinintestina]